MIDKILGVLLFWALILFGGGASGLELKLIGELVLFIGFAGIVLFSLRWAKGAPTSSELPSTSIEATAPIAAD